MRHVLTLLAAATIALASAAHAQSPHEGHGTPTGKDSQATKAYRAANDKMHEGMAIKFANDADIDFIRGMIPHHQGAIDMAKVVLQYGKDEQTRKLATDIIRAQEREIAEMQEWLKKKGW